MKITKYLLVLIVLVLAFSCGKDNNYPDPFDHAGQAVKDEVILKEFLETHYYIPPAIDEHFGRIDTITDGGETPLFDQVSTEEAVIGNITYNYYYLKNNPIGVNDKPSRVDSVLVNYKGRLLYVNEGVDEENKVFDENTHFTFWGNLYGGVIPGWSYGMTHFESGVNTGETPIRFEQNGKGLVFMPSGLGYRDRGTVAIPSSSPLIFHIEMAMVKHNDQDVDGIKSIFEDLNNDGNNANDDTDDDGTADFIDFDDDNDGLSTKYENADVNADGNPDDAIDTDSDAIPDYLDNDDDGDGILTKDENADPNGDGDPSDAKDSDGDDIPDYLDAN